MQKICFIVQKLDLRSSFCSTDPLLSCTICILLYTMQLKFCKTSTRGRAFALSLHCFPALSACGFVLCFPALLTASAYYAVEILQKFDPRSSFCSTNILLPCIICMLPYTMQSRFCKSSTRGQAFAVQIHCFPVFSASTYTLCSRF